MNLDSGDHGRQRNLLGYVALFSFIGATCGRVDPHDRLYSPLHFYGLPPIPREVLQSPYLPR